MARLNRHKGIARVEVLVIAFVGVLLLAILPPVLRHAKSDAARETCRANLARIGKAMLVYARDYDDELPRSGGRSSVWGEVYLWNGNDPYSAFGLAADGSGGKASISSCFYLLVKYMDLQPKDFVCPGDAGTTEFRLADLPNLPKNLQLTDAWDFGPESYGHCSYAYQLPFGLYALTLASDPQMPVAADRNPWLRSPAGEAKFPANFKPDTPLYLGIPAQGRYGNSRSHGEDGQNVLFRDGHVSFKERSYCGRDNDNIYLIAGVADKGSPMGMAPALTSQPMNRRDSVLVHDPAATKTTVTHRAQEVDSKSLKQTAVVATLDCPLPEHKNVIWCSTFQMAWDKFKTNVIGEPIQLRGAEQLADRLNLTAFRTSDIEENSCYANAGFVENGIIEQIRKDMAKRFPSEPVPVFDERYRQLPDVAVAYAYLNVDVGFKYTFYSLEHALAFEDSNGVRTGVAGFCTQSAARGGDYQNVREQVEVLHYDYGNGPETVEFAIDLCRHARPYQVILARIRPCKTLGETTQKMQEQLAGFKKDSDYEVLRKLRPIDALIVPEVLYKLTHHFEELLGKRFRNQGWREHFFFEALQKINFTLSRSGVTVKSEARMGATTSRRVESTQPRHLHFDKPFLICVRKREAGATPFFLMWVDNAELMKSY